MKKLILLIALIAGCFVQNLFTADLSQSGANDKEDVKGFVINASLMFESRYPRKNIPYLSLSWMHRIEGFLSRMRKEDASVVVLGSDGNFTDSKKVRSFDEKKLKEAFDCCESQGADFYGGTSKSAVRFTKQEDRLRLDKECAFLAENFLVNKCYLCTFTLDSVSEKIMVINPESLLMSEKPEEICHKLKLSSPAIRQKLEQKRLKQQEEQEVLNKREEIIHDFNISY